MVLESRLEEVKTLLGCKSSLDFVLIYFVGAFDNNPFVAPFDQNRNALCLPIESGNSEILLVHELTHIVHAKTANLTLGWQRTIALTILEEGLATRVSKFLVPGEEDERYIEHKKDWLTSCMGKKEEIFKGIFPYLDDDSSETVYKFTIGKGTTNQEREAYYVGWELVNTLLKQGVSFKELARIEEKDIPILFKDLLIS
ncbi:hypothetical protein MHI18_21740 [Peribacillus sp. FSL H8-0477]|uniref:hypothetical protein n=1 Tax=Peribacillus sp. FSL H8-0477 TaxID=2921388 RepID=UPI0030FB3E3F